MSGRRAHRSCWMDNFDFILISGKFKKKKKEEGEDPPPPFFKEGGGVNLEERTWRIYLNLIFTVAMPTP